VYYLHRNDVRYKKILRGCRKYFIDKLSSYCNFNRKEKRTRVKFNNILSSCSQMSQTMGLGNLSIEFTIYLSAFLFPREVLDGIEDMHMADILFR